VQFDERQMSRAVLNLLNNAYDAVLERRERWHEERIAAQKAGRKGASAPEDDEPPASIALRSKLRDDRACIEIADTGGGIPPDVVSRIFEPYFTTKFHGTGLGLMNVLRIVEEHGGKVLVETDEGEGTRFTLVIPMRAPLPVRRLEERKPPPGGE
jgi:signal transduction histidine kinase